jgi:hypothetical protein
MAKHRGISRRRLKKVLPPAMISGAAVVTVAAVGGVAVTNPESVANTMYDLSALIVEGSSTNPTGAGIEEFYGGKFQQDPTVTANFFTGPFGIYQALGQHVTETDNVVLSSGWGAANASLLLTYLDVTGGDDPIAGNALYVLDNNVARPNGGFGTRYPIFALIGVNPIPTPTSPGVQVIDVGYEYDINGNTPAYVLNPVAMANSLATYFDNRLNQSDVDLPVNEDGTLDPAACGTACQQQLEAGEEVAVSYQGRDVVLKQVGDTTYVSYRADGLPLLQPLRQYGGEAGQRIAYVIEPAVKAAVDYGYPDNDALANPERYVPARLIPRPHETATFVNDFTEGVRTGIDRLDDDVPTTGSTPARVDGPAATTAVAADSSKAAEQKPNLLVRNSANYSPKHAASEGASRQGQVRSPMVTVRELAKRLSGEQRKSEAPAPSATESTPDGDE